MLQLDHLILRVRNHATSLAFYRDVVGLSHLGTVGPFEILRANPSLTLDLMEEVPAQPLHLAFALDQTGFEALQARLAAQRIPIGSDVFLRDGRVAENPFGARGMARAFYFYDPDGHNLEARHYDSSEALVAS